MHVVHIVMVDRSSREWSVINVLLHSESVECLSQLVFNPAQLVVKMAIHAVCVCKKPLVAHVSLAHGVGSLI